MKALTLWQPWAWAVAAGHKPIENRPWPPPSGTVGQRIALHAGKIWDRARADSVLELSGELYFPPEARTGGAIVGFATIVGYVCDGVCANSGRLRRELLDADEVRWYFGPFGWVLRDPIALERPVPCRGFQKLWELPGAVEAEVLRQLSATASTV